MKQRRYLYITVSVVNFNRRRLYGLETASHNNSGFTFWLPDMASDILIDIFKSIKAEDKVIIGYDLVNVDGHKHKFIRSIMKDVA